MSCDSIRGLPISTEMPLKLALFADVLLFSNSPTSDLPCLVDLLSSFRQISGLKINFSKSVILKLTNLETRRWQGTSPFIIEKHLIKHLGIYIRRTPDSKYSLNYRTLITHLQRLLELWQDLPLSLLGRIHLFKMVSFPRLLYPLQILPLNIPKHDIQEINKTLTISMKIKKTKDTHR